jgi:processive 1,2-diacylglycerol beta-glucosyltransferase
MIELHDTERGTRLGTISDEQLQFLVDALEEESLEDKDYYISADTIDMLEEDGADRQLLQLLRGALGGREGMDVRWSRRA